MSQGWGSLPLLPLRCILDHLCLEDALAAMSTCRHWRNALLLYEGKRKTLKLSTTHLQKNMFLTRMFRKHTRSLEIYILAERDLEKFMNLILPQFFESTNLKELMFIGPRYVQQIAKVTAFQLKRVIIESLIYKHSHCLERIMYLGCQMGAVRNENEKYSHKLIECYSRPLSFNKAPSPADAVMSSCNVSLMVYSTLKHILVDYDQVNTETLEVLSNLKNLSLFSLNVIYKRHVIFVPLDWTRLEAFYPNGLDVAVNFISVPPRKFIEITNNILVEGIQLTSVKFLFCRTLYSSVLRHVVRLYQDTLRELVWVDSPQDTNNSWRRYIRPILPEVDTYDMNPFMLLCWKCMHLKRLVIHGYWIWQYDLLGFVRLSKKLTELQVSATYEKQNKFGITDTLYEGGFVRVLTGDRPEIIDPYYEAEINNYVGVNWKQRSWNTIHPALSTRPTLQDRMDYVVYEISHPYGVTFVTITAWVLCN